MAFRKTADSRAAILDVWPQAAIPGGEVRLRGRGLLNGERPRVHLGGVPAHIVVGSESMVIVKVPEGANNDGELIAQEQALPWSCNIGVQVADSLHPVANPVVDRKGNIYSTLSGTAGTKTPVSIYKIDADHNMRPLVSDLMNATGLALDAAGALYCSSRNDGVVYQVTPAGNTSVYVEGMGVATGIAFDQEDNLYVGDRSGTIFKISRQRQIYVFATLEPSIAAYHLAFGPDDNLYVTGPTTSSYDHIYRITPAGNVEEFYRGLGRPQGMAFDAKGNLYIAASLAGRRGVVRINPDARAELYLSGPAIVGLAFTNTKSIILATANALYRVDAGIEGRRLP
jgi:sugar lactone lactonase YvrE